jgi:trimeric autotransporter adhesin
MKTAVIVTGSLLIAQLVWAQNVGIGTNTPAFKLDVRGSINSDSLYRIAGSPVLSAKFSGGTHYTFVGVDCGFSNTTGNFNTGTGYRALYSNTSGDYNTANGAFALSANTTGTNNTAIGVSALMYNTQGHFNTATGSQALMLNSEGNYNTATGNQSLYANTTGSNNTACGIQALSGNSTGSFNTAIGAEAMREAVAGIHNTALGYNTLRENTGSYNTVLGSRALSENATGNFNTAIGFDALYFTTNSSYNTAIGYKAGHSSIGWNLGWNNTLIGSEAHVSFDGQYNSIAIGNIASCPDNSTVRIGNPANWSYGGYANWTNVSDERYKMNVQENVPGVDFIMKLRPVTYQMDVKGLFEKINPNASEQMREKLATAIAEKEQMVWTGFIAQEVEAAAVQSGFNFSGVDKPRNEYGVYGLRYAEFVVPLVKAVQEQQQMIEDIKKEIALLKEQNKILLQQ